MSDFFQDNGLNVTKDWEMESGMGAKKDDGIHEGGLSCFVH